MWKTKILWSDCADAQADRSLRLMLISEGMFSHVVIQIGYTKRKRVLDNIQNIKINLNPIYAELTRLS